jgi:hypothetical protein
MDKELFDDLITSCNEAIEYKRGNINLKTTILDVPDEEVEFNQVFFQNLEKLSDQNKQKAMQYVNKLLRASNG